MPDQQLLNYIIAQEHAGYAEPQIAQALAQSGYSQADIKDAFSSLQGGRHDPHIQETAQQYARQGYAPEQTFDQLTRQGYDPASARTAVKHTFGSTSAGVSTIAFVIVALLVGAGGMYFLVGGQSDAPLPQPGPPVSFSPSEIIAEILQVARTDGTDTALSQCESRLVGKSREQCTAAIALSAKDRAICSRIADPAIHDSCLLNFLDDLSVCDDIRLIENQRTCEKLESLQGLGA